jgi:ABC-type amino acid transport system permease subunit
MSNLVKALIGLAALAFVLAVLTHFSGPIMRTHAEGYSRASANLALLAIALVLTFGGTAGAGRSL